MSDIFTDYGQDKPPQDAAHPVPSGPPGDLFTGYPMIVPRSPESSAEPAPPLPGPPPPVPIAGPEPEKPSGVEEVFVRLNSLVGLAKVKAEFVRLHRFAQVQEIRRAKNLPVLPVPRHAVFYSLPGAGKTTIARLYGQLLRALGVLRHGHVVETDRLGLAGANYTGQTSQKTQAAMAAASGGVLFIDDAHALYKDDYANWDAGGEIIQMVLERLNQPEVDFAVILGGYPDSMEKMVQSHDGLKNLFANHFHFEDYDPDELQEIFERLCQEKQYELTTGARRKMKRILKDKYNEHDPTFGNARYVSNLFQSITRNQAARLGENIEGASDHDLVAVLAEDIVPPVTPGSRPQRPLGFDMPEDEQVSYP